MAHSGPGRSPSDCGAREHGLTAELERARSSGSRLPDFFIVGHAKCGTTALYRMLTGHPQVYMSAIKEPEYLSRAPHHPAEHVARPARTLPQTLDAYLALFEAAGPEQRAGEASTEYLRTPGTARRIAELRPDAWIIAMLREPVSFLSSLHLQLLQMGIETEPDFARAIALEPERRLGRRVPRDCSWPPALLYSDHVRYVSQLREFHHHFGRERVLTLIYDDFRQDNAAVLSRVLRFLELPDAEFEIVPTEANPTMRVRSRRGERLVNALAVGRGPVAGVLKGAVSAVTPRSLRRHAHRAAVRAVIERDPPPPTPELTRELRVRYGAEVLGASDYLGRDLADLWGYRQVT